MPIVNTTPFPVLSPSGLLLLSFDNDTEDAYGHVTNETAITFDAGDKSVGTHSGIFNGTSSLITINDPLGDFTWGSSDFTFEMYLKPDTFVRTVNTTVVDMRQANLNGPWFNLSIYEDGAGADTGKLHIYVDSVVILNAATALSTSVFTKVAVVRQSGEIAIFLNDVQDAKAADVTNYTGGIFRIGWNAFAASNPAAAYQGKMDHFRVYDNAQYNIT